MVYLKGYKKKKKPHYIRKFVLVVIIFVIMFELIVAVSNKLKGDNIDDTNISTNSIEQACGYVVGISKDNIIATGQTSSWGSGVIVSTSGYIITNAHVCGQKYEKCYVVLDYDNYYTGEVVWSNEDMDLAFVKVNTKFKDCINLSDSDRLTVGQDVYSIGNPISISFQKSVGKGIISGLNRNVELDEDGKKFYMGNLIQTDAVINYGNSGGALTDVNGDLIGINTIRLSDADLIGFAIPINIVKPIIQKLEERGNFEEGTLKIWCYDKYSMQETSIRNKINNGIYVAQIDVNSNAEKAGLRVGDVIKYVDTEEVNTIVEFKKTIYSKNIGDNVILKVDRGGKEFFINIQVEKVA